MKNKFYFSKGERGNVSVIGETRSSVFADETLFARKSNNKHTSSACSIHVEGSKVLFTPDGNPFFGGATIMPSKAAAVTHAKNNGFEFDPVDVRNFLKNA
jgi:hypothetical protein